MSDKSGGVVQEKHRQVMSRTGWQFPEVNTPGNPLKFKNVNPHDSL